MSSRAWVTLATNDSYGLGALVLAHSLRRAGSAYPAVVLITPSVTEAMRDRLSAVFAEVVTVDVLDSGDAAHLALLQRPELGITFTKIHCWNLTQYEKCVFLDADILVVQNCDELFEREELSAAPDVGWPDCFNSGVFVFKPSAETFSSLIIFAQERGSFDGGDQGLLNSYFSDWAHGDIKKHLPFLYNVTSAAFYSYLPALKHYGQNLKIIHFIGAAKPWLQQFNWESRSVDAPEHLRELLQLWWDLFVSQVHRQLDTSMSGVAGNLARVSPGAVATQYEVLDELTRRQGWEAGNIDYMGADSFANIWAKISQTLSQPPAALPKQPSPPPKGLTPSNESDAEQPTSGEIKETPSSTAVEVQTTISSDESEQPSETSLTKEDPSKVEISAETPASNTAPVPVDISVSDSTTLLEPKQQDLVPSEVLLAEAAASETATIPVETANIPDETSLSVETSAEIPVPVVEAVLAEVASSTGVANLMIDTDKIPATVTEAYIPVESCKEIESETVLSVATSEKVVAPLEEKAAKLSVAEEPKIESPNQEISKPEDIPVASVTDSPPLANTPSKEEIPTEPAAKSEERRRPAGKLQLRPPVTADPLPTPDSELEDAATLAQSIIASELRTPTVTSPTPPTPASPAQSKQEKRLSVEEPQVPTPPVGSVSLSQIGVKPAKEKSTIAAQIESSVSDKPAPTSPTTETKASAEAPKKKVVKKVLKKDSAASGEAPVPPPRKKEKKPKENERSRHAPDSSSVP